MSQFNQPRGEVESRTLTIAILSSSEGCIYIDIETVLTAGFSGMTVYTKEHNSVQQLCECNHVPPKEYM